MLEALRKQMNVMNRTFWVWGLVMLALQGCVDDRWHSADYLASRGWASAPEKTGEPISPVAKYPTSKNLYCYKSLGQVDCFKAPQKGKDHLRVGQEAPALPKEEVTPCDGPSTPKKASTPDESPLPLELYEPIHVTRTPA
jgi:hypothetical protein